MRRSENSVKEIKQAKQVKQVKLFRRTDIILIVCALAICSLIWFIMYSINSDSINSGVARVVIELDGELYGEYPLATNRDIRVWTGGTNFSEGTEPTGYNLISIEDRRVYIKSADCPTRICVKEKRISKSGQSIVCLPHHLTVRIEGGEFSADAYTR